MYSMDDDIDSQVEEFDSTSSSSSSSSCESSSGGEGESSCDAGESEVNESQEDEGQPPNSKSYSSLVAGKRRKRYRKKKVPGLRKKLRTHLDSIDELNPEALNAQSAELERIRRLRLQQSVLGVSEHSTNSNSTQNQNTGFLNKSQSQPSTTTSGAGESALNRESSSPELVVIQVEKLEEDRNAEIDAIVIDSESDSDSTKKNVPTTMTHSKTESRPHSSANGTKQQTKVLRNKYDVYDPRSDGRILVNVGHPPGEEDIFLAPQIARVVKPHQVGGVRFLYDNIIESVSRFSNSPGFGCILAHSMGLGKTLQVISFIELMFRCTPTRHVLCVVPVNTLQNWISEFDRWIPTPQQIQANTSQAETTPRSFKLCVLSEVARNLDARLHIIKDWQTSGGVLLIGYEMFRLLSLSVPSLGGNKMATKKRKNIVIQPLPSGGTIDLEETEKEMEALIAIQQALCCPGPDLVVCDEGHRIKNDYSNISQSLKRISTRRRIVMTGYPLQNNLTEYWCMVDFVRPKYLGTKQEFADLFERPITNGQCMDSTPVDVRLMRYRSHVLHRLLEGFVLRRGHEILKNTLPPKFEHVLFIRPSDVQAVLYDYNMSLIENSTGASATAGPLKAFAVCSKIWNHPDVYFHEVNSKRESPTSWLAEAGLPKSLLSKGSDPTSVCKIEWPSTQLPTYQPGLLHNSPKMTILMELIDRSVQQGDRILIFSQTLSTLTYVEKLLSQRLIPIPLSMDQNGAVQYSNSKWTRTKNYCRLDGSTNSLERDRLINYFNSSKNQDCWVFLLSTKAGCLGINLIGANRVVVLDVSWNPCYDAQAVCRVYRYGQTKPCYIYRLVCDGTMERKIYDRQISKQGMSDRVVDELHPERHLTSQDIINLIAPLAPLPAARDMKLFVNEYLFDPLLMEICKSYGQLFTKPPFKHESLLVDSEQDRMTEVEKIIAVKSFQQHLSAMKSTPAPGQAYKSHVQVQRPQQIPHASSSSSSVPPAQVTQQHSSRPQPAFTPTVMRKITPAVSGPSSSNKQEIEVICLDSDDETESVPTSNSTLPSIGTSVTAQSTPSQFSYGNVQGNVQHMSRPVAINVTQHGEQLANVFSQGANPLIRPGGEHLQVPKLTAATVHGIDKASTEVPSMVPGQKFSQQQPMGAQTVSQSVTTPSPVSVPLSSCSTLQLNSSYNNSISAVASILLAARKQGMKLPMYSDIDRLVAAAKFLCQSDKSSNQSDVRFSCSGESQSPTQANVAEHLNNTVSTQTHRSITDADHFTSVLKSFPSSQQLQVNSHLTSPPPPLRPTTSTQTSSTTGPFSLTNLLSEPVVPSVTNTHHQTHRDLLSPPSTRSTTPSPIRTPSPFSPPKQDTSAAGHSVGGGALSPRSLSHSNSSSGQQNYNRHNNMSPMNPPSHTPVHSPSKSFSPPATTNQAVSPKGTSSPGSASRSSQTCGRKLQKPNSSPKLHSPKQRGKSTAKFPFSTQVPSSSSPTTQSPVQSHSDTVSSQSSNFTNQKRRISNEASPQASSRQSGRSIPHSISPSPVSTPTSYTPSSIPLLSPVAARLLWLSTGTQLPSSPPEDVAKLPPLSSPTPILSPRTAPQPETIKKDYSHSSKESSTSPLSARSVDLFKLTSSHSASLETSTSFYSTSHTQSKTSSSSTVLQNSGPIRMCSPVPYSNAPSSSVSGTNPSDSLPKTTSVQPMMGSSLPLSSKSAPSKKLLPLPMTCSTFAIGQSMSQGSSTISSSTTDMMNSSKRMRPSCISIPKSDTGSIDSSQRNVTGEATVMNTTPSCITASLQRKALTSSFHRDPKTQPLTSLTPTPLSMGSSNITPTTCKTSLPSQAQRINFYSLSSSSREEPTHSVVSTGTQSTRQSLTMAGELRIVSAENPLLTNFNNDRTLPATTHNKTTSPISLLNVSHRSRAPVFKPSIPCRVQNQSNSRQSCTPSFVSNKPGTSFQELNQKQPPEIPSSTAVYHSISPVTSETISPTPPLRSIATMSTTAPQYNASSKVLVPKSHETSSHRFQPTTRPLPVQKSVIHTHTYTETAPANKRPVPAIIGGKYGASQSVSAPAKTLTHSEVNSSKLSHGYTPSIVTQVRNEYSVRPCSQNSQHQSMPVSCAKPRGSVTATIIKNRTKSGTFPTVYQHNQLPQVSPQQRVQGCVGQQEVKQFGSTAGGGGGLNHRRSGSTGGHSQDVGMTKLYHPSSNVVLN